MTTGLIVKFKSFIKEYRFIILLTIAMEFFTFVIITLISGYVPPNGGVAGKWRVSQIIDLPSYIFNISRTWDGIHYINIAQNWYSPSQPSEYAFFPFFPLLIKTISSLFPFFSIYTSSFIVSSMLFIILGILLKKMFKDLNFVEKSDELSLIAIIFPLSIFYLFVYTESLFICITIISSIFLKKLQEKNNVHKLPIYLVVLIGSFLLSITRNLGFLFGFSIFFTHLMIILFNMPKLNKKEYLKYAIKPLLSSFSFLLSGIIGLVSVLSIGYYTAGDFLKSYNAQQYWGRVTEWNIFKTIYENLRNVFTMRKVYAECNNFLDCVYGYTYPLFGLLVTLIVLVITYKVYIKTIYAKNNLDLQYLYIFSLVLFSIIMSTLSITKGLNGYNRYIIATPMYYLGLPIIILKTMPQKYVQQLILFCTMLFTVFICLFGLHHWVG
jgi:hypothetical protein